MRTSGGLVASTYQLENKKYSKLGSSCPSAGISLHTSSDHNILTDFTFWVDICKSGNGSIVETCQ